MAGLQNYQNLHSLRAVPYKVPQNQFPFSTVRKVSFVFLFGDHSIERFDAPVIQCIDHCMGENLDSKLTFVAQCPEPCLAEWSLAELEVLFTEALGKRTFI